MPPDANVDGEERLVTGHTGRLLLTVSLGWGVMQGGRLVVSPMLPAIKADLGLTATEAGFAFSMLWGLYALLQYPSGRFSDDLSRKTLLVSGLVLLLAGFTLLASAPTYPLFLLGALVVGFGAGFYPTAARALVSDLFVKRRGQAFGLHTASGDIGGVLAAGLAAPVLAVATWRAAFLPVVALLAVVAGGLHVWSAETYVFERPELNARQTAGRIFADRKTRWLLVAYSLFSFTWQAATGFLPTYFEVAKGFDPLVGQVAFASFFGVGALVKPVSGGLSDRFPRALLAPAGLGVAAVALGAIVHTDSPVVAIGAVLVFGAGLMSYPPVMQAYLMDLFPDDSAGGDLGAMRTTYITLGAVGPTYVGVVADAVDYRTAFIGVIGCLVVSAVLILFTTR